MVDDADAFGRAHARLEWGSVRHADYAESISGTFTATDALGVPGAATLPITVQASGAPITVYHGQTLVLNFAGTGSKDHAGTIVFDQGNAALGAIDGQWASAGGSLGFLAGGAFTGADAQYNPGNVAYGVQTSGSTIAAPHIYSKSCAKGTLAYNPPGSSAGEPTFTAQIGHNNKTFPKHTFISFKYRVDPLFVFGLGAFQTEITTGNSLPTRTGRRRVSPCRLSDESPLGNLLLLPSVQVRAGCPSQVPHGVGWQCAFDQASPSP